MEQVLRERSFVRLLDDRDQEEHFSQPWQSSLLLLGFVRLSAGSLSPFPHLPALEGKVPAGVGGSPSGGHGGASGLLLWRSRPEGLLPQASGGCSNSAVG